MNLISSKEVVREMNLISSKSSARNEFNIK